MTFFIQTRTLGTIAPVFIGLLLFMGCGDAEHDAAEPSPDADVVATVETAIVREGSLVAERVAYGTTVAAPGAVRTLTVPFEAHIRTVQVGNGQGVDAGSALLSLEPSAEARVLIEQARTGVTTEQTRFEAAAQRFDLHLATREELAAQKQAYEAARARYESLARWADQRILTAPTAGTIDSVLVRAGALVPAGAPLLDLVADSRYEIRLGVDPETASALRPGQPMTLEPLYRSDATPSAGIVRSVAQRINPATRLVDVLVSPAAGTRFLLAEYVRGRLPIASREGLVVPRRAVLPEDDHYLLFVVSAGVAVARPVTIELASDDEALIRGAIAAGDSVVVLGNYELEDGMRVRTRPHIESGEPQ